MKFTEDQLNEIRKYKPSCCFEDYGRKGDLIWGFDDNKIYIDLEYQSTDINSDSNNFTKRHINVTFDELIKTIKEPYRYFDTRSLS